MDDLPQPDYASILLARLAWLMPAILTTMLMGSYICSSH